ncbi:MAG: threonine synthase [Phototrophicaceae bacterium]
MAEILHLQDTVSGAIFSPTQAEYFNPAIGQVATLDVLYDYERLRSTLDRDRLMANPNRGMWRYRELLPLASDAPVPPLAVGGTPLYEAPRLAQALGLARAWVKDDGANPTASLKDRASSMVVAVAMSRGITTVSTASTGNAAAALAGVGASIHQAMDIVIFVPSSAPIAKIAQLLVYGARVVLVKGTYDQAFDLCYDVCLEKGWYCRNTGINPYTTEGKKTVSFEIAEQLQWQVPDVVVVSVGDGSIIGGIHKGFVELHQLGWIDKVPRLIGVQAQGSSPLVQAWQDNMDATDMQPMQVSTLADSISAGLPRDRMKALRAVRSTQGALVAVTDDEIVASIPKFARLTGVFAEPSSSAIYAGIERAIQLGYIHSEESVVFVSTGNGLKDVARAQQSVTQNGLLVEPDLNSVLKAINQAW